MSLPNVPDITPEIKLKRREAINLLLTSIAMEEMAISHILNAEGEKIQYVLSQHPSVQEILQLNQASERLIRTLIKKEMLLQFKLENIIELEEEEREEEEAEECIEE